MAAAQVPICVTGALVQGIDVVSFGCVGIISTSNAFCDAFCLSTSIACTILAKNLWRMTGPCKLKPCRFALCPNVGRVWTEHMVHECIFQLETVMWQDVCQAICQADEMQVCGRIVIEGILSSTQTKTRLLAMHACVEVA